VSVAFRNGQAREFDEVVIATHSDEALAMLGDPTEDERSVLGALPYRDNEVILHTDTRLLPKLQRAWSSWNYRLKPGSGRAAVTYNMNILQGIDAPRLSVSPSTTRLRSTHIAFSAALIMPILSSH
jgi:predicted NAD/FAD-binding protein